MRLHVGLQL